MLGAWRKQLLRTLTRYLLIFKIQMCSWIARPVDALWRFHVIGMYASLNLITFQPIKIQRFLWCVWVHGFNHNYFRFGRRFDIFMHGSLWLFVHLITSNRKLWWCRGSRGERPIPLCMMFGIPRWHLGLCRLATVRWCSGQVANACFHTVGVIRQITNFVRRITSPRRPHRHIIHSVHALISCTMTMEDILELLSVFISVCFGWGIGVFLTLSWIILALLLLANLWSFFLFLLALLFLNTFRKTTMTFLVCMEWLLNWSLHISIQKSAIFWMSAFARCNGGCMARKISCAHALLLLGIWLVCDNPRRIQFQGAIGGPLGCCQLLILMNCICSLNWRLQATRRILFLRIFRHVHLVCDIIHRGLLTGSIIIIFLYHILFLNANLAWIDDYYITITTLARCSRLSQIQQILATHNCLQTLITMIILQSVLPVDHQARHIFILTSFAPGLTNKLITLVLSERLLRRTICKMEVIIRYFKAAISCFVGW